MPFIAFTYLTLLAINSSALLNKSGESEYLSFVSDLRGKAFIFENNVNRGFFVSAPYQDEEVCLYS